MDWGAIVAGGGGVTTLAVAILWSTTGENPRLVAGGLHRAMIADKDREIERSHQREERSALLTERTVAVAEAMMTQIRGQGRRG